MRHVSLVSMPFSPRSLPSLGLSSLKAVLRRERISSNVVYLNQRFARLIGNKIYDQISEAPPSDLLGDWVFRGELFGEAAKDAAFAHSILGKYGVGFRRGVSLARDCAGAFLELCVEEVLSGQPTIIGLSSTFAQHVASLAFAKRVKERRPSLPIIIGGANCENEMGVEVARSFPFVDAVVSGEAENVIAELVDRLMGKKSLHGLCGIYTPCGVAQGKVSTSRTETNARLDSLPFPDFVDFVAERAITGGSEPLTLSFEASRGCWWGAKHHCTFCGLNGSVMAYRSKSALRVVDELRSLRDKYGATNFIAADNILDYRAFNDLLPKLAEADLGIELFFEVKANLKKSEIYLLRAAGARAIQPGIESLDSEVLGLMRKGTSGLQNVQTLKWCQEIGILACWNMLWGFPGERSLSYDRVLEIIPLLTHLTPPECAGSIRLDRFSPHFESADAFGLKNVRPGPAYGYVYDLAEESVANLAYYFCYESANAKVFDQQISKIEDAIAHWREIHDQSRFVSWDAGKAMLLLDWRFESKGRATVLSGLEREIFVACDAIRSRRELHEMFTGSAATRGDVDAVVSHLTAQRFVLCEDQQLLSLAVPLKSTNLNTLGADNLEKMRDFERLLTTPSWKL